MFRSLLQTLLLILQQLFSVSLQNVERLTPVFNSYEYTRCMSMKPGFQTTDGVPEQFCYKDLTLRHFVVSSTSVKRARVTHWEKCVNNVMSLCLICRNLY